MLLLRNRLNRRIGHTGLTTPFVAQLWGSAAAGAAVALILKRALASRGPIELAAVVLGTYGVIYLGATMALRVPEAAPLIARLKRAGGAGWAG